MCPHSEQPERLEVDPSVRNDVDFGNIVHEKSRDLGENAIERKCVDKVVEDEEFVDDPEVPPLI